MASEFGKDTAFEDTYTNPYKHSEEVHADEITVDRIDEEHCSSIHFPVNSTLSSELAQGKIIAEEESIDVEIGNFFLEDGPSGEVLPPEVLELQKRERMREISSEKNLEKLDGIWKKVVLTIILFDL